MRRLLGFLKELRAWLLPLPAVVFVLGSLIAGATVWWGWPSEQALRLAGLELELFGVVTVVWGILETRELFGLPSIWTVIKPSSIRAAVRRWWSRRPRWYRHIVLQVEPGVIRLTGSPITAGIACHPDAPLEQRVAALEANLKLVTADFQKEMEANKQKFRDLSEKMSREQDEREQTDKEIRETITKQETGGLHISAMGAVWIFVGATLATVPDVILETLGCPPDGIVYVQAVPLT